MGKIIKKVIPHIALIFTAMLITLLILNYLNPLMGFLTRGISKLVIGLWIVSMLAAFIVFCMNLVKGMRLDEYED